MSIRGMRLVYELCRTPWGNLLNGGGCGYLCPGLEDKRRSLSTGLGIYGVFTGNGKQDYLRYSPV